MLVLVLDIFHMRYVFLLGAMKIQLQFSFDKCEYFKWKEKVCVWVKIIGSSLASASMIFGMI